MGLGIKLIGEGGIRSYRKIGAIVGMVPIVDRETCRVKGNDTADEQGTALYGQEGGVGRSVKNHIKYRRYL